MAEGILLRSLRPSADAQRGWKPALDGLRGVALLGVLLYHHSPRAFPGGFLGVSLFFTLSGFLITSMLLREHSTTGTIDLRRFWARRARRLVPVALAGLALATVVAWWTRGGSDLSDVAADVRYAVANLANWHQISSQTSYGDAISAPSPVAHYWSLAIEEQFYLVFPVAAALALRAGRRALAVLLLTATAASLGAQLLVESSNRAYLGTDTRLAEMTIGALLAVVLTGSRSQRGSAHADWAGLLGLGALATAWRVVDLQEPLLYRGGLLTHAVLAAVVIIAALHGRQLGRLLGSPVLVALGLLSYGIYVVHFPLFLLLSPERTTLNGPALFLLRLLTSIAVAATLHWLVERPVRWGGSLPGWRGAMGWLTATTAVVVVAVAIPHVQRDIDARNLALGDERTTVLTMPAPIGPADGQASVTRILPTADDEASGAERDDVAAEAGRASAAPPAGSTGATSSAPTDTVPTSVRPMHLLVVGDSTAVSTGLGLQSWAAETGRASVDVVGGPGCAFEQTGVSVLRPGWERPTQPACLELLQTARSTAVERPPDAVLVFIGSIQLADWRYADGPTLHVGEEAFDVRYTAAANAALVELEALGVPVLWATLPVPNWEPSKQFAGWNPPGSGPLTINSSSRTALLNELNRRLVGRHPLVRLVPFAELISRPDGTVDERVRPDGLHVAPEAVPGLMVGGLEDLLRTSYSAVTAAIPSAAPKGVVTWST